MRGFTRQAQLQAALVNAQSVKVKVGIVTSYDPVNYRAKVSLQPENILTGWLPISSQWVGSSWGLFMPPNIDQHVRVEFLEGNIDTGIVTGNLFSQAFPPLSVPAGEMLMQHVSGSLLHFANDGSVKLIAAAALDVTAQTMNVNCPETTWTGNVVQVGTLTTQGINSAAGAGGNGDATFNSPVQVNSTVTATGDVKAGTVSLENHDHTDPQGGVTGAPNG